MSENSEQFQQYLQRTAHQEASMRSPDDDRVWIAYDSGLARLEQSYQPILEILGFKSIKSLHARLIESGQTPIGLELAGQGKVFGELGMKGVAVSLAIPNFLTGSSEDSDFSVREDYPDVGLIAGDIGASLTWQRIYKYLPKPPNFVFLTPAGGIKGLPKGNQFIDKIIKPVLNYSQTTKFIFLGDYPYSTERALYEFIDYQKSLNSNYQFAHHGNNEEGGTFGITNLH